VPDGRRRDPLSPTAIVRRRLYAQRLLGATFADPAEAVGALVAVQAQEFEEAKWALSQRLPRGWDDERIEAAFARGEILRTHALRPTWHFVTPADARWLLALNAPRVAAAMGARDRQLELDARTYAHADRAIARFLEAEGPQRRKPIAAAVQRAGVATSTERMIHILMHSELEAIVCSGPREGAQHTYDLLDRRAPTDRAHTPADPVAELAERYFASHGPATERDFAWWSGLKMADVRAGVATAIPRLREQHDGDGTRWFSSPAAPLPGRSAGALMLGAYEETTIAYKDLRVVPVAEAPPRSIGWRPILAGDRMAGLWKRTTQPNEVLVEATLLAPLGRTATAALERETRRFGRFLGRPARLVSA
jgi:hypothetical protein